MKYLLLFVLVFQFAGIGFSQNLVPNPSFEEYTECPDGDCQIHKATGWYSYGYTPDYFNACENQGWGVSVPTNMWGYQFAATGNAYCGLGPFSVSYPNAREYIGSQLITPLIIGQKYYVSLKICFGENISLNCASNKMGVLFSTINYALDPYPLCSQNTNIYPLNFAHLFSDSIVSDTENWTTISGSFISDSTYNYLIVGNFFDNSNTDFIKLDTSSEFCTSYYFIDDIYVSKDSLTSNEKFDVTTQLSIYPIPANEYINVILPETYNNSILSIYNVFGKLIKTFNLTSIKQTLNIKEIEAGLYIVHIQTNNTILKTKFIKN